jgi:serine/threonine-protein kinase
VKDFAAALRAVETPHVVAFAVRSAARRDFTRRVFARVEPSGALFRDGLPLAPVASINNGAAGIAYAHYRAAIARDDAEMLARADTWIVRARQWATAPEAFYTRDRTIDAKSVGPIALYHTMSGVRLVDALIGLALGDTDRAETAGDGFIQESSRRTSKLDVTLGKAGIVLGGLLLLDASPIALDRVRRHCDRIARAVDRHLGTLGPIANEPRLTFLGIAHGWSGILYSLLRWYRFLGATVPAGIRARVEELSALVTPRGRGMALAWSTTTMDNLGESHPAPSWCNGSAGQLHLWLEAHRAFNDARYLDLAEAAAWNVWDDSSDRMADACCGMVGRSYALLALHRATQSPGWLRRAQILTDRAMEFSAVDGPASHRLYKGALGAALLIEELETHPGGARMPLFESEGWAWR